MAHPKRKLLKDVSIQELYAMREHEKMTNAEIAQALGISIPTVLKYIGKQPRALHAKHRRTEERFYDSSEEYFTMEGNSIKYHWRRSLDAIDMETPNGDKLSIFAFQLEDLISELRVLHMIYERIEGGKEG